VTRGGHAPDASVCSAAGTILGIDSARRLTAHPIGATASPLGYYEYLPPGDGSGAKQPLLIFLHGAGGNGDGTSAQLPNVINDAGIAYYSPTTAGPPTAPSSSWRHSTTSSTARHTPIHATAPLAGRA
jgi:poly(3-hydroxybutyrate) depolymerase